jgi:hypothetical protein
MSPEQAAGEPIDHRSDIYGLGVVLYEMLVGERPFVAETPIGVLLKHLQDPAPSVLIARPDLPSAVGDVIDKVLVKVPAQRYNSAGELARAFRAAFVGGPELSAAEAVARPLSEAGHTSAASAESALLTEGMVCPECGTSMPAGAGICPACKYMIPLDQMPRAAPRPKLQHREVVINLLSQGIRWTPGGLQVARRLAAEAMREVAIDGWEPASTGVPFRLIEGRTIGGPVVESAILSLERLA